MCGQDSGGTAALALSFIGQGYPIFLCLISQQVAQGMIKSMISMSGSSEINATVVCLQICSEIVIHHQRMKQKRHTLCG